MRVFVSSTARDLPTYRLAVALALERLGLQVARMEAFGARPDEPTEACFEEVEGSELFVGIYAHRYGFVPTGSTSSITESEFDYAYKLRRPPFCFFVDSEYPWPEEFMEQNAGKEKLSAFKARIEKLVVRDVFTTPDVLATRVIGFLVVSSVACDNPNEYKVVASRHFIEKETGLNHDMVMFTIKHGHSTIKAHCQEWDVNNACDAVKVGESYQFKRDGTAPDFLTLEKPRYVILGVEEESIKE